MKKSLTAMLIFTAGYSHAQPIGATLDSTFKVLNMRIAKLEADTVKTGKTLQVVGNTLDVNQTILNQLSTMQATITSQQAAIEALRVRLAGLKAVTTIQ